VGHALGTVLPLAVAVAIFPVPIIVAVLLVGSDGGRAKGVAFVSGWVAGLAAVGAIVLLIAGAADASDEGDPATWANVLLLVLGLVLVVYAVKQWRGRPGASEEPPIPGWMRALDDFSPLKAVGAGFALTGLNPKNVLLTVAAAVEIGEVGLSAGEQIVALVVFVAVASLGVLGPLIAAVALGDRSREPLARLRGWMARNSGVIMAVLCLLIGAKLVGDAISGFSS
jgi:threonine/homoserine/homoserine lactone efflux protein